MTPTSNREVAASTPAYTVKLIDAPSLTAEQRQAAELLFRTALESAIGGPSHVLPVLKACMLARSLLADLPDDGTTQAEREVIKLWEDAEDSALKAALSPLQGDHVDARFEIHP